jgi:hypothetical protein
VGERYWRWADARESGVLCAFSRFGYRTSAPRPDSIQNQNLVYSDSAK